MRLLLLAIVLLSACAQPVTAPRPAAQQRVIPLGLPTIPVVGSEQRTGAPSSLVAVPTAPASPTPSRKLGDVSTGRNPHPPADPTWQASWYATGGPGLHAAIRPDLGRKGQLVVVCGGSPFHCETLPIVDVCYCGGPTSNRAIDLSASAFAEFAPLSRGVVQVTVEVLP